MSVKREWKMSDRNVKIKGDVTGSIITTGDNSQITQKNTTTNTQASVEDFLAIVAELKEDIFKAEIDADEKQSIEFYLKDIEQKAAQKKPNSGLIKSLCETVVNAINPIKSVIDVTDKLTKLVKTAGEVFAED